MQPLQAELERAGSHPWALLLHAQSAQQLAQPRHVTELGQEFPGRHEVRRFGGHAIVEPTQDGREIEPRQPAPEHLQHRVAKGPHEDLLFTTFLDAVELDPTERVGDHRRQVDQAGDRFWFTGPGCPSERGRHHPFEVADRIANRDAAALVDLRRAAELGGQRCQELLHERGHAHRNLGGAGHRAGLLVHDGDLVAKGVGVVGADLRPEPVFQRGDDPAAMRVVLRVGRGDQQEVERETDLIAPDLDVALLQDVEQGHLDPFGQVGQLVDGHDAPVGAGDQPVVDGQLVGEIAAFRDPDRIDVADQVGHAGVGRGELLRVPAISRQPGHQRVIALLGEQRTAPGTNRPVRVVVHLAARDHRRLFIQQLHQVPDQPGLGLAPLTQQDQIVAGEDAPLQ
jgi:hypothetical protein